MIALPMYVPTASVLTDDRVESMLKSNAVVAVGVSGGKDGAAAALAVASYLDAIKFDGPRILIHADLGLVEWKDSLLSCQRLAELLGWELAVVRRQAGDMMTRWNKRWENNVSRYTNLECVKLILPWSTASMRYCTAELKRDPICSYLAKRFPGKNILSATGIRREESPNRAKSPISKEQPKLKRTSTGTDGIDWHPILNWSKAIVFEYLQENGLKLHEAYTTYGSSRVSCSFCILAKKSDLYAAAGCKDNEAAYLSMCELELKSTFSFQPNQWLCDVASYLLSPEQQEQLVQVKKMAQIREAAEARIPKHLLYTKGWPTLLPTLAEAKLLVEVRKTVAAAVGLDIKYVTAKEIRRRYEFLIQEKATTENRVYSRRRTTRRNH